MLAWDRDLDCIYVTSAQKQSGMIVSVHAAQIRALGPDNGHIEGGFLR